jgi:hypothetical protein
VLSLGPVLILFPLLSQVQLPCGPCIFNHLYISLSKELGTRLPWEVAMASVLALPWQGRFCSPWPKWRQISPNELFEKTHLRSSQQCQQCQQYSNYQKKYKKKSAFTHLHTSSHIFTHLHTSPTGPSNLHRWSNNGPRRRWPYGTCRPATDCNRLPQIRFGIVSEAAICTIGYHWYPLHSFATFLLWHCGLLKTSRVGWCSFGWLVTLIQLPNCHETFANHGSPFRKLFCWELLAFSPRKSRDHLWWHRQDLRPNSVRLTVHLFISLHIFSYLFICWICFRMF